MTEFIYALEISVAIPAVTEAGFHRSATVIRVVCRFLSGSKALGK